MSRISQDFSLKTSPGPFRAVWRGQKKAELRKNDRGYQVGDRIRLMEHDGQVWLTPYRYIIIEITHIVQGGPYGLAWDHVMFSFKVLERGQLGLAGCRRCEHRTCGKDA